MRVPILKNNSRLNFSDLSDGFVVLINKPMDWTSFDVCKKIRNYIPFKKVGHAGTLDPFATGLLIIGVGKGTKEMSFFLGESKNYEAEIKFGISTDSYDRTGNVIRNETFKVSKQEIQASLKILSGKINQIPPMFSAKKVNGKALYRYARKGLEIDRKEIPVHIYNVELVQWENPLLKLNLHVSKGTYIRSYANDLGNLLQIPALLNQLKRVRIGDLKLQDSFSIDQFFEFWKKVSN